LLIQTVLPLNSAATQAGRAEATRAAALLDELRQQAHELAGPRGEARVVVDDDPARGILRAAVVEGDLEACGYVFLRSGAGWALQRRLIAGHAESPVDVWGSVALWGDKVLPGSPSDTSASESGAAYVFGVSLQPDVTPPQTTAALPAIGSRAYDGWHDDPVTFSLSAADDSGCDASFYRLGTSGDFRIYDPERTPTVKAEGETALQYSTVDFAGNVEPTKMTAVRVDTRPPTKTMAHDATARPGRPVKIRFRVNDPLPGSGKAKVLILILKNGHLAGGAHVRVPGKPASNAWQSCMWSCSVARGTYEIVVTATDLAGNDQRFFSAYPARLTVR
jgi:hypothetical protein